MRLVRRPEQILGVEKGCALTIGNFDGVHLGHRQVIEKLSNYGQRLGVPVVVAVFEPQPLEFFEAEHAPSRLTRLREKAIQIKQLPVDQLLVLRFNRKLASYEPEAFVREILVGQLNVKYILVGDDFHFGKARRGNFSLLQQMQQQYGFKVENSDSYRVEEHRVSSTLIRDGLSKGDLEQVKRLLGRPYSVCGRVVHGDQRGRTIGFPTANVQLYRKNTPIEGVYAVTMTGISEQPLPGVANVGTRPTVDGGKKVVLETHLLDFNQDIYGSYVEIHFHKKLRDEAKFASIQFLQEQIKADIALAKHSLTDFISE